MALLTNGTACLNFSGTAAALAMVYCQPADWWAATCLTMALLISDWTHLALVQKCAVDPDNRSLWQEFMRRYDARIRRAAIRVLQRYQQKHIANALEEVDDIVQEVYARFFKKRGRAFRVFKGVTEESWFCYLRVITRHITLNALRARRAQKRARIEYSLDQENEAGFERIWLKAHSPGAVHETTDEAVQIMELQNQINYCLDLALRGSHKHRDKLIFQLYHFDGLLPAEIARIAGFDMTPHAVEMVISRVRQKLAHYANKM